MQIGRASLAVFALSLAALSSAQSFGPKTGEFLILRIRTFHAKDWSSAKAEMLKAVVAAHKADKTKQDVILAEDPTNHRMLALAWADKANFKPRVVHNSVPHLNKIMSKPKIEREFKVFAVNDEKIKPKVGDAVVLYWPSIKKGSEAKMESMVKSKMFPMLKADKHDRDSFAVRDLKNGSFLAVAISPWGERNTRLVSKMDADLKAHHTAPLKTEVFKIVHVHLE